MTQSTEPLADEEAPHYPQQTDSLAIECHRAAPLHSEQPLEMRAHLKGRGHQFEGFDAVGNAVWGTHKTDHHISERGEFKNWVLEGYGEKKVLSHQESRAYSQQGLFLRGYPIHAARTSFENGTIFKEGAFRRNLLHGPGRVLIEPRAFAKSNLLSCEEAKSVGPLYFEGFFHYSKANGPGRIVDSRGNTLLEGFFAQAINPAEGNRSFAIFLKGRTGAPTIQEALAARPSPEELVSKKV